MTLPELLKKIPDLNAYYVADTGEPLKGATSLSWEALVVALLVQTFDFDDSDRNQLLRACDTINQIVFALRMRAFDPFQAALEALDEDFELAKAQLALMGYKARGGVDWEDIKKALGI